MCQYDSLVSVAFALKFGLDARFAQAFVNRGIVRLVQGKTTEADLDFEKGFSLDPNLKAPLEKFIRDTKRARN